jgi:hypothetical protein
VDNIFPEICALHFAGDESNENESELQSRERESIEMKWNENQVKYRGMRIN